jgi:hypothetical protein
MRTYVVRVQDARTTDQPDALRGVADDVATGRRSTFASGAQLLRLLTDGPDAGEVRTQVAGE